MTWIDLSATVTTPVFAGRAGPTADTFRITELRGALRWWLRALLPQGAADRLSEEMFGAVGEDRIRPSIVRFRPRSVPQIDSAAKPSWLGTTDRSGQRLRRVGYLLGPGLYDPRKGGSLRRGFVAPGARVELAVDPGPHGAVLAGLLWLLGALGGVGARSRRCFGGVAFDATSLRSLAGEAETVPGADADPSGHGFHDVRHLSAVLDNLRAEAGAVLDEAPLVGPLTIDEPDEEARRNGWVSKGGRWIARLSVNSFDGWEEAADYAGERLRTFRAPHDRGRDRPPHKRYERYERYVTEEYAAWTRGVLDEFAVGAFGLPAVFPQKFTAAPKGHGRRASPLWLRPVQTADGDDTTWRLLAHASLTPFLPNDGPWKIAVTPSRARGDQRGRRPPRQKAKLELELELEQSTVDAMLEGFLTSLGSTG